MDMDKMIMMSLNDSDMTWEEKAELIAPKLQKLCDEFLDCEEDNAHTQAFIAQLIQTIKT